MEGILIWSAICLAVAIAARRHPLGTRIGLGFFFLSMGPGVNLFVLDATPELFVEIGAGSVLSLYSWFFSEVVARSPFLFGGIVVVYEAAVGLLMLTHGEKARAGVIGGMLFLVLTAPLNSMTWPNLILAVGMAPLLWNGLESSRTDHHSAMHA